MNNKEIIKLFVAKDNCIERFTYEKIMKYNDFIELGKLFKLCDNIEEIYDMLLELINEKKISIKEINNKNILILNIELKIFGVKNLYSADIKLLKNDRDLNELINALFKKNNDLVEEINNLKKNC